LLPVENALSFCAAKQKGAGAIAKWDNALFLFLRGKPDDKSGQKQPWFPGAEPWILPSLKRSMGQLMTRTDHKILFTALGFLAVILDNAPRDKQALRATSRHFSKR
jgi:hypothetical protein